MKIAGEKGLLPAGLTDGLPPFATQEAQVVERSIAVFAAQGYDRVKPPLLEFEDTLLAGADSDLAAQTFRLMDPVSQRMLGLRADMTPQVARIAATRLAKAARPLRLCYGGQVLQVKGSQMRPERQFGQVGVELIGAPQEQADAEVILLAAEALAAIGIGRLSIDLNLPTLVGALADTLGMTEAKIADLSQALDRKDVAAVGAIAGPQAAPFAALLRATGPVPAALDALRRIELPDVLAAEVVRLCRVIDLIRAAAPDLTLTVDLAEHRGFEYHSGISFIVFARGVRGELGRGGRYNALATPGHSETASTGFTLYMDSVLRALPKPKPGRRIYLPPDCAPTRASSLRAGGWVTVGGLDDSVNARAEAARLDCSHVLLNDRIEKLED